MPSLNMIKPLFRYFSFCCVRGVKYSKKSRTPSKKITKKIKQSQK